MKILEILMQTSTDGASLGPDVLARATQLLGSASESPLLANDELRLTTQILDMARDEHYSPSMLVIDFLRGVNAKLAIQSSRDALVRDLDEQ